PIWLQDLDRDVVDEGLRVAEHREEGGLAAVAPPRDRGERDVVHTLLQRDPQHGVHEGPLVVAERVGVEVDVAEDDRARGRPDVGVPGEDRKSTRLNSSDVKNTYAV